MPVAAGNDDRALLLTLHDTWPRSWRLLGSTLSTSIHPNHLACWSLEDLALWLLGLLAPCLLDPFCLLDPLSIGSIGAILGCAGMLASSSIFHHHPDT